MILTSSSSSEFSSSLYDICGDFLNPLLANPCSFPELARSKPKYGGEGFIGREMYSGWYCTPTKKGWSVTDYEEMFNILWTDM